MSIFLPRRRIIVICLSVATELTAVAALAQKDDSLSEDSLNFLAWMLGSRISLAAVFHDRDAAAPDDVKRLLESVQPAASQFGAEIPALPLKTGRSSEDSANILYYLLTTTGEIYWKIVAQHGMESAALFEVAMMSNLLLLVYTPGGDETAAVVNLIRERSPQAGLPAELWQPLVQQVMSGADYPELKSTIFRMHDLISRHLDPF